MDAALHSGYYQGHPETLPWVVLAVVAIALVQWVLRAKKN
jgi:hypothetical protein